MRGSLDAAGEGGQRLLWLKALQDAVKCTGTAGNAPETRTDATICHARCSDRQTMENVGQRKLGTTPVRQYTILAGRPHLEPFLDVLVVQQPVR